MFIQVNENFYVAVNSIEQVKCCRNHKDDSIAVRLYLNSGNIVEVFGQYAETVISLAKGDRNA